MNIVQRNFFRLLRAGAFGSKEQIEPMSAWKWGEVLRLSVACHVEVYTLEGIRHCSDQFFMSMPSVLLDEWRQKADAATALCHKKNSDVRALLQVLGEQQLRPILIGEWATILFNGSDSTDGGTVLIFFPFDTQGQKADAWAASQGSDVKNTRSNVIQYEWRSLDVEHRHRMVQLNNRLSNTALQRIIEEQRREEPPVFIDNDGNRIETINPTLSLLVSLTELVRAMLGNGIETAHIIDLGMQIRQRGHRVDFLKLIGWIERLHLERVAWIAASMLTQLMGFADDEVPFVEGSEKSAPADSLADALLAKESQKTRYFRYMPGESIASILASVAHSLNQVEE